MSSPLLLRALSFAGRKAAACPPLRPGAQASRATTTKVTTPSLLLRALSSRAGEVEAELSIRAGEVEVEPRRLATEGVKEEEITINSGGVATTAASGGDVKRVGVGMCGKAAPLLIVGGGATGSGSVPEEGESFFNPRPRVAALVCLVADHKGQAPAAAAIQDPQFLVLEDGDDMTELICQLIVAAAGGYPEHGETTGGFVALQACGCGNVQAETILSTPTAAIIKQSQCHCHHTNVSSLGDAAVHSGGDMMIPVHSGGDMNRGGLLSTANWCSGVISSAVRSPVAAAAVRSHPNLHVARYHSTDAYNAIPTTKSPESSNESKKRTKKSKVVDEVNNIRALMDELIARLGGIDNVEAHLELRVNDLEQLVKSIDKRMADVEDKWEVEQLVKSFDKRMENMEEKWEAKLRVAEMAANIAEKRADQLEKMVDAKIANVVACMLYKQSKQEELVNSHHSLLLRLYTQLAQEASTTKDELHSVRRNYRDDILAAKGTVSATAWRIVLVLLGGFGAVTLLYLPYVIKDIKLETTEEALKRVSEMLQAIIEAVKRVEKEETEDNRPWWKKIFFKK